MISWSMASSRELRRAGDRDGGEIDAHVQPLLRLRVHQIVLRPFGEALKKGRIDKPVVKGFRLLQGEIGGFFRHVRLLRRFLRRAVRRLRFGRCRLRFRDGLRRFLLRGGRNRVSRCRLRGGRRRRSGAASGKHCQDQAQCAADRQQAGPGFLLHIMFSFSLIPERICRCRIQNPPEIVQRGNTSGGMHQGFGLGWAPLFSPRPTT